MFCPECGKIAVSVETKYGLKNHCKKCDLWSWGNNSPLVNAKTHRARIDAHYAFDKIWQSRFMTRSMAYEWLAKSLGISSKECHMKKMNFEMANKVILVSKNFSQIGSVKS